MVMLVSCTEIQRADDGPGLIGFEDVDRCLRAVELPSGEYGSRWATCASAKGAGVGAGGSSLARMGVTMAAVAAMDTVAVELVAAPGVGRLLWPSAVLVRKLSGDALEDVSTLSGEQTGNQWFFGWHDDDDLTVDESWESASAWARTASDSLEDVSSWPAGGADWFHLTPRWWWRTAATGQAMYMWSECSAGVGVELEVVVVYEEVDLR